MRNPRRTISVILLLCYIGAVIFLCFFKFDNLPSIDSYIFGLPKDKIVHFLMFLPFPFLVHFCCFPDITGWKKAAAFSSVIFLIGCLGAAATEFGQGLTDYRSMDAGDLLADAIALVAGSLTVFFMNIRHKRH